MTTALPLLRGPVWFTKEQRDALRAQLQTCMALTGPTSALHQFLERIGHTIEAAPRREHALFLRFQTEIDRCLGCFHDAVHAPGEPLADIEQRALDNVADALLLITIDDLTGGHPVTVWLSPRELGPIRRSLAQFTDSTLRAGQLARADALLKLGTLLDEGKEGAGLELTVTARAQALCTQTIIAARLAWRLSAYGRDRIERTLQLIGGEFAPPSRVTDDDGILLDRFRSVGSRLSGAVVAQS